MMIRYLFLALIFVGLSANSAIPLAEGSGVFWKITKQNQVGYLYGTIHRYPQKSYTLSAKVQSTLANCKTLAIERNIRDNVDQNFFIQNLTHRSVQRIYPIVNAKYGNDLVSMEGQLLQIANLNGIRLAGLEKAEEVLALLAKTPEFSEGKSDAVLLKEYERAFRLYKKEQFDQYVEKYLVEDLSGLGKGLLIDQRNLNWLGDIEQLLARDEVFIAVGMGHLGGEKGLLALLEDSGYTLERIKL